MSYRVAVRTLCEFTARRGDLDRRFTPAPSAQEGIAGHQVVGSRRTGNYQREVSLSLDYRQLQVRGRADGYDADANRLEEIKTHRGDLERQPDNHRQLHWAQARIYGWMLCQARGLQQLELALVYFDLTLQQETLLQETWSADALQAFFESCCDAFIAWADQELLHRQQRNQHLHSLPFPHDQWRSQQRELAEAVYKAACTRYCLTAQAPTGIGKTLATLFPLLKAMSGRGLDKLFFLSAKTLGRQVALDTLHGLGQGNPLRVLELCARDSACEHPDKDCHGESCPLAAGFHDRLPQARQQAAQQRWLDRQALREIASQHQVCPYYLGQEMARWSDVVVADYNYYFDLGGLLLGLTQQNDWQVAVLVDEAHNLLDRGRGMYSAELERAPLRQLRRHAPPLLKPALDRVTRHWNTLLRDQDNDYQVLPRLPGKLLDALQQLSARIAEYLLEHPQAGAQWQSLYFDLLHLARIADLHGDDYLIESGRQQPPGNARLSLRNLVPARLLAPRLQAAHCCVLFSATFSPARFYQDMLGLPVRHVRREVAAPFSAEQLQVHVCSQISTRYRQRAHSVQPIAQLIAHQYRQQPGNYLAFFSSFDYLQHVAQALETQAPDIVQWSQSRHMDEGQRRAFLDRFSDSGQGIGFAVLGGAFAEGVDLPGRRLIGCFIATLGLPQVNPGNQQVRQRLDQLFPGQGYDYAYLYPGLQKVVQAAGRVIRTPQDRGYLYLIDDRFADPNVRQLLPDWWQLPD